MTDNPLKNWKSISHGREQRALAAYLGKHLWTSQIHQPCQWQSEPLQDFCFAVSSSCQHLLKDQDDWVQIPACVKHAGGWLWGQSSCPLSCAMGWEAGLSKFTHYRKTERQNCAKVTFNLIFSFSFFQFSCPSEDGRRKIWEVILLMCINICR